MQTEGKFLTPNCNEVCDGIMPPGHVAWFASMAEFFVSNYPVTYPNNLDKRKASSDIPLFICTALIFMPHFFSDQKEICAQSWGHLEAFRGIISSKTRS